MPDHSAIFSALSKQRDIAEMRPLSAVKTEAQQKKAEKDGYFFGFTARTWSEKYPRIPTEHIFCTKTNIIPGELVYFDRDKYIFLNTTIYNGTPMFHAEGFEEYFCGAIKKCEREYADKNYRALVATLLSEENGNIALYILNDMLEREPPSPELYSLAISAYSYCNGGVQKLSKTTLRNMLAGKSEEQKTETRWALREILSDPVTIYRGAGSRSTPLDSALSWSLDENVAYFFAGWRGQGGGSVYTARVRKENIIEYSNERNEREVIVLPEHVMDVQEKHLLSFDTFVGIITSTGFSPGKEFPLASYPENIKENAEELYEKHGKAVSDHDCAHSIRVALLASFLFRMEVLSDTKRSQAKFNAANAVYRKLLIAIAYHDVGREDNSENENHGAAGYACYLEDGNTEDAVIRFLTTFHCIDLDESARAYWRETFEGKKDADTIWLAYQIIRDADALDRVRFGRGCSDYLDVGLLRLNTSKALVPVAMYLAKSSI